MRETPRTISVPPSVKAWVERRYEPQNEILFRIFHKHRSTQQFVPAGNAKVSGIREKKTLQDSIDLVVRQILEGMPVWKEASDDFRDKYGDVVRGIFYEEEFVSEVLVIQSILKLRESYEYRKGINVDVEPKTDEIADIYRAITDRLSGVFEDVDETPTAPDLKRPEKKAVAF